RHDRQRVGMDERLVLAEAPVGRAEGLLHSGRSARRPGIGKLRPVPAQYQDSPQGAQRRLAPVRAELLPPLPARRTSRAADRYVDQPCRVSVRGPREEIIMRQRLTGRGILALTVYAAVMSVSPTARAQAVTEAEAQAIATEPGKGIGGPMNTFVNIPAFPTADRRIVVRPNFDTLYSSGWLDLTNGPVVVSVPDTAGRYYLLPMLDMWTDVFASPGWRTTGTQAADFLIVPPGWRGAVPAGFTGIDAP